MHLQHCCSNGLVTDSHEIFQCPPLSVIVCLQFDRVQSHSTVPVHSLALNGCEGHLMPEKDLSESIRWEEFRLVLLPGRGSTSGSVIT